MKIVQDCIRIAHRKEAVQVGSLYVSMVIGIALGFGVTIVNTRLLGPEDYGNLKFLIHVFTFTATVTTFGFFISSSRLLAIRENKHIKSELIGGSLTFASIISFLTIVILCIFSFFVDDLFHPGLGRLIRLLSPLLFIFPFRMCLENILQGDNRILQLATFRIIPQLLYLLGALAFNYFVPLSLPTCLSIQLGCTALVILIMFWLSGPKTKYLHQMMSMIHRENKAYGFHVYLGMLANVATGQLLGIFLGYFLDTTSVGFYSLALMITTPLSFVPSAFGTTLFKTFANRSSIPTKAFIGAICLSVLTLIAFFMLIEKIIILAYSAKYKPVVPLAYIAALGSTFQGFGDFINRFLGAHGKGRELRNTAFCVGAVTLAGCFVLIPSLGTTGTVISKMLSSVLYCSMMCHYYRKRHLGQKVKTLSY